MKPDAEVENQFSKECCEESGQVPDVDAIASRLTEAKQSRDEADANFEMHAYRFARAYDRRDKARAEYQYAYIAFTRLSKGSF